MLTNRKIIEFLEENKDIIKDYGVKRIGLFGSHIRNEQRPTSDVDILVEIKKTDIISYILGNVKYAAIEAYIIDIISKIRKYQQLLIQAYKCRFVISLSAFICVYLRLIISSPQRTPRTQMGA